MFANSAIVAFGAYGLRFSKLQCFSLMLFSYIESHCPDLLLFIFIMFSLLLRDLDILFSLLVAVTCRKINECVLRT